DSNSNIAALPVYDTYFGTLAFVPLPAGMGFVRNEGIRRLELPSLVWEVSRAVGPSVEASPPSPVAARLNQLGVARLELAPSADYAVPQGLTKGLPPGVEVDPVQPNLRGRVRSTVARPTLGLVYGRDSANHAVAAIWVSTKE